MANSEATNPYDGACVRVTPDYDSIETFYVGQTSSFGIEGNYLVQQYTTCINTAGNTEQYCAAKDKCLRDNNNVASFCNDDDLGPYYNGAWVSGSCDEL